MNDRCRPAVFGLRWYAFGFLLSGSRVLDLRGEGALIDINWSRRIADNDPKRSEKFGSSWYPVPGAVRKPSLRCPVCARAVKILKNMPISFLHAALSLSCGIDQLTSLHQHAKRRARQEGPRYTRTCSRRRWQTHLLPRPSISFLLLPLVVVLLLPQEEDLFSAQAASTRNGGVESQVSR